MLQSYKHAKHRMRGVIAASGNVLAAQSNLCIFAQAGGQTAPRQSAHCDIGLPARRHRVGRVRIVHLQFASFDVSLCLTMSKCKCKAISDEEVPFVPLHHLACSQQLQLIFLTFIRMAGRSGGTRTVRCWYRRLLPQMGPACCSCTSGGVPWSSKSQVVSGQIGLCCGTDLQWVCVHMQPLISIWNRTETTFRQLHVHEAAMSPLRYSSCSGAGDDAADFTSIGAAPLDIQ